MTTKFFQFLDDTKEGDYFGKTKNDMNENSNHWKEDSIKKEPNLIGESLRETKPENPNFPHNLSNLNTQNANYYPTFALTPQIVNYQPYFLMQPSNLSSAPMFQYYYPYQSPNLETFNGNLNQDSSPNFIKWMGQDYVKYSEKEKIQERDSRKSLTININLDLSNISHSENGFTSHGYNKIDVNSKIILDKFDFQNNQPGSDTGQIHLDSRDFSKTHDIYRTTKTLNIKDQESENKYSKPKDNTAVSTQRVVVEDNIKDSSPVAMPFLVSEPTFKTLTRFKNQIPQGAHPNPQFSFMKCQPNKQPLNIKTFRNSYLPKNDNQPKTASTIYETQKRGYRKIKKQGGKRIRRFITPTGNHSFFFKRKSLIQKLKYMKNSQLNCSGRYSGSKINFIAPVSSDELKYMNNEGCDHESKLNLNYVSAKIKNLKSIYYKRKKLLFSSEQNKVIAKNSKKVFFYWNKISIIVPLVFSRVYNKSSINYNDDYFTDILDYSLKKIDPDNHLGTHKN